MITVPTIYLVLVLLGPAALAYVAAATWLDRRYLDPWLRRRLGLPPKDNDHV